jgi:kynurenine formamidase
MLDEAFADETTPVPVIVRQETDNDVPVDVVTPTGATSLSIDVIRNGIVGRGVLLGLPRLRGQPWLEPGDTVTDGDLRAAEAAQRLHVGSGDLLFVRVGHSRRRKELGAWDVATTRAGLHPTALEFAAERKIAVLGGDSNNDAAPSTTDGVDFPVHAVAMNALGIHLLDYLQFEDLAEICERQDRWTFLAVIAPLRLPAATGSPINPIATF